MMNTQDAYRLWARTYDTVENKTRDLESIAIRAVLDQITVDHLLEIGCGTGKNTAWLAGKARYVTATDFSPEMLAVAAVKVVNDNVRFIHSDITKTWPFAKQQLITCSLVLEHISDLPFIFNQASRMLDAGGRFYICELHPYKQLAGSSATFEQNGMIVHVEHFIHHVSAYYGAARASGFQCEDLREWFDDPQEMRLPRLISFLFGKASPEHSPTTEAMPGLPDHQDQ